MRKVLFILLIMCFTLEMFAQNIMNFNNQALGVTNQYTTLAAAVAGATNGDIIYLYPTSTIYGSATINKNRSTGKHNKINYQINRNLKNAYNGN